MRRVKTTESGMRGWIDGVGECCVQATGSQPSIRTEALTRQRSLPESPFAVRFM